MPRKHSPSQKFVPRTYWTSADDADASGPVIGCRWLAYRGAVGRDTRVAAHPLWRPLGPLTQSSPFKSWVTKLVRSRPGFI